MMKHYLIHYRNLARSRRTKLNFLLLLLRSSFVGSACHLYCLCGTIVQLSLARFMEREKSSIGAGEIMMLLRGWKWGRDWRHHRSSSVIEGVGVRERPRGGGRSNQHKKAATQCASVSVCVPCVHTELEN